MKDIPQRQYPAPAKLNLFLHIVGVRKDGKHLLQTLFRILDYGDTVACRQRSDRQLKLHCNMPKLCQSDNLVLRATRALSRACGVQKGVDLYLHKRIPVAAGLGGGSSDAATALHLLNQLWECGLSETQLAKIGMQIGADIPLFIYGKSAWGEGIGEKLSPTPLRPMWYVVLTPPIQLSTAQQYRHPAIKRDYAPVTMADYQGGRTSNVFEPLARQDSTVDKLMRWLDGFAPAKLSGTGPSVYAEFDKEQDATQCIQQKPESVHAFVARGLNISPLHDKLGVHV